MIVIAEPPLVIDSFLGLDTEEYIVHPVVRFAKIVAIVCADERKIELFRQFNHHWIRFKFLVNVVILHLNIEVPFPHDLHQGFEILNRFVSPIRTDELRYLSLDTPRQCDNPVLGIRAEFPCQYAACD